MSVASHRETLIASIRASSRQLVRAWGILERKAAGTDLSLSAVHAILEIGFHQDLAAKELTEIIGLEKSSVSRLLKNLEDRGLITSHVGSDDKRKRCLRLTGHGMALFEAINLHADRQVGGAIDLLDGSDAQDVEKALALYAVSLHKGKEPSNIAHPDIKTGYCPGLLGEVAALHAHFYSALVGFGSPFEARVASDMASFITRLSKETNQIWHVWDGARLVANVAIDGEDLGEGIAHLRWFIAHPALQGSGLGRQLLTRAIQFCNDAGFQEIHLWTFEGLHAARHLYEQNGFVLAQSQAGKSWGKEVMEQKFIRTRQVLAT